jgi:hypothetical protein
VRTFRAGSRCGGAAMLSAPAAGQAASVIGGPRLTGRWAAAWLDLVDGLEGARVLVSEWAPGKAPLALADVAKTVAVADPSAERQALRRELLAGARAEVVLGGDDLAGAAEGWDVVVLDGAVSAGALARFAGAVRPDGRVIVVADNASSPIRQLDRVRGRPAGPAVGRFGTLARRLAAAGLAVEQVFGLLRSSVAPVTAFDVAAPRAAEAVFAAAGTRIAGPRHAGLRLLAAASARGRAAPIVPAWLVIARPAGAEPRLARDRPTGRLGYDDSQEVKIVRGDPPAVLEKRYEKLREADAETMALAALAEAGIAFVPRQLARPAPLVTRETWMRGRALNPDRMTPEEIERRVLETAEALAVVQARTARDGRVLVHGDLWLGNVLVEAGRLAAIIDWTDAYWGERTDDADHLVSTLVDGGILDRERAAVLRQRVGAIVGA